ncbi:MAG: hydroxymethylglutaryl-CoA reductase, degradative [Bacteriovoracaceae bacterium]|nr:hydroxymethylglutaryl-CoA reductase, degradative [Bacteriovoracaceae bacterium]
METIAGFSKLSKSEKIQWLSRQVENNPDEFLDVTRFWLKNSDEQKVFDEFSENTITNYYFPYGIAPNFLINGKIYCIPMVIEESSVVAAASKSANFWLSRGGFKAEVISTTKVGQVHFEWFGKKRKLKEYFEAQLPKIWEALEPLCVNMKKRGGGVKDVTLVDMTQSLENYYQIKVTFETCDAMGANFINTILEEISNILKKDIDATQLNVIMSILSNYTPECLARVWVDCPIEDLADPAHQMSAEDFANKFLKAVQIANVDVSRAVTHNKGILNGIDSVVLATGNDFRAVEACAHAYAARDGQYRSLTSAKIENNHFVFSLEIPLSLGTVGGLTTLHPLAKLSLNLLQNPNAEELMLMTASVGLAQNFAAIRSLITTGIQKGHMRMHLLNILKQMQANRSEIESAKNYFSDKTVSFTSVRNFLNSMKITQ